MGAIFALLKPLLIIFLIYYIIKTIGRFLLSVVLPGYIKKKAAQQNQSHGYHRPKHKRPSDGNVNIDYNPGNPKKGHSSKSDFKGGDYVDYEEVK